MGGFSSRGGAAQKGQVEEVTVAASNKPTPNTESSSVGSPKIEQKRNVVENTIRPWPADHISGAGPQSITGGLRVDGSIGSGHGSARQGGGQARPKNGQPQKGGQSSLRVNHRNQGESEQEAWGEVLADMAIANAEEEEMQRAIEASIMDSQIRSASVPVDRHSSHQARHLASGGLAQGDAAHPFRAAANDPYGAESDEGSPQRGPRGRGPAGPTKAATSGLRGGAWVDNSSFQVSSGTPSQPSRCRSVPASTRGGMPVGGSGIVTLPRIQQPVPAQQQEMVKELHEKIKGTMSARSGGDEEENDRKRENVKKNPRERSIDVRHVLEENNLDDTSLVKAGRGGKKSGFNDQFHSCGGDRGAQSSGLRH